MLDFLSYLWWRITHPGPGLSPTDPVPYVPNYPRGSINWRR